LRAEVDGTDARNVYRAWSEESRAFWSARLDALDKLLKAEDAAATQQTDKKGKPR
jgi:hypothetical protein